MIAAGKYEITSPWADLLSESSHSDLWEELMTSVFLAMWEAASKSDREK
jgi:hypothetical protein